MTLNIRGVRDIGQLPKERVVMSAATETQLANLLMVAICEKTDGTGDSFNIDGGYWFPTQIVKPDDVVIVYTKSGTAKQKTNASGNTSYFYYLGKSEPFWGAGSRMVAIAEIARWESHAQLLRTWEETEE